MVAVGYFNTHLAPTDRSSRQKINQEILYINDARDQMEFTGVYRIFHPVKAQYTIFSEVHGTFFKINHILGHKARIHEYKK
jgi:hypothetical protein